MSDYFFNGASTSEYRRTASGNLCPLTSILLSAVLNSMNSLAENFTVSAAIFSLMYSIWVVPGKGTINDF